ncbi:thiamine phosphate synthase [Beijerinckia sp. L45]|uniref:thiamine phosphate synthase n=1 Tax=Beijerinckia sp. L45 TaxID=1641855 RepID=UPI00131EBB28|nr:thiamine phosphate synthase [Beijerinckia sp. L45]
MSDEAPRLFLITPPLAEASSFVPLLEAALAAGDVACLLVRTSTRDEGQIKAIFKILAPIAQAGGTACLVEHESRIAARADADGVHMAGVGPELEEAIVAMRPDRIVGVGGLNGRDAAMEAGEAGVDYLMFGGPDDPETHESIRERVQWWAEIFNIPCVGYVSDPSLAGDMALAGAEFIALCDGLWDTPEATAATVASVTRAIALVGETVR